MECKHGHGQRVAAPACARTECALLMVSLVVTCTLALATGDDANERNIDWVASVRRKLHERPELMFEEVTTSQLIRDTLDEVNVEYQYPFAHTGVVASIGSGEPTIAFRSEMDALPIHEPDGLPFRSKHPGVMHACGHDAHMAILLGVAKKVKPLEKDLHGTIKLIFQPGEEGGAGAKKMIEEGALEGVQAIFAVHNAPFLDSGRIGGRAGVVKAGSAVFHIDIQGIGGHDGMPAVAVDPVIAAAQIITQLQVLASRETDPLDSVVVSITQANAGAASNVIPTAVELGGTLRALQLDTLMRSQSRIDDVVHAVAAAHSCNASVDWSRFPLYPPTTNDVHAWEFAKRVASGLFGSRSLVDVGPVMAAEDFSFMLHKIPGSLVWLGQKNVSIGSHAALHNPRYLLDESVLNPGVDLLVQMATTFLKQGGWN